MYYLIVMTVITVAGCIAIAWDAILYRRQVRS